MLQRFSSPEYQNQLPDLLLTSEQYWQFYDCLAAEDLRSRQQGDEAYLLGQDEAENMLWAFMSHYMDTTHEVAWELRSYNPARKVQALGRWVVDSVVVEGLQEHRPQGEIMRNSMQNPSELAYVLDPHEDVRGLDLLHAVAESNEVLRPLLIGLERLEESPQLWSMDFCGLSPRGAREIYRQLLRDGLPTVPIQERTDQSHIPTLLLGDPKGFKLLTPDEFDDFMQGEVNDQINDKHEDLLAPPLLPLADLEYNKDSFQLHTDRYRGYIISDDTLSLWTALHGMVHPMPEYQREQLRPSLTRLESVVDREPLRFCFFPKSDLETLVAALPERGMASAVLVDDPNKDYEVALIATRRKSCPYLLLEVIHSKTFTDQVWVAFSSVTQDFVDQASATLQTLLVSEDMERI